LLKPFETESLLKKATTLLGGFPMHYKVALYGEIPLLTLLLDELAGPPLAHLRPALNAARKSGVGSILLDITRAQRVDPVAADEILAFVDEFRPGGGRLDVVHPRRGMGVRAVVGRLTEAVTLHDSLEAALEAHGVLNDEPRPVRLGQASGSAPAQPSSDAAARVPTRTSTAKGVVVESHPKATIMRVTRTELGEDFFELLAAEVAHEGAANLLLEFRGLTALGSTEAWELAALAERAGAAGRSLRVVNPPAAVAEALEGANIGSVILRTKQGSDA
ncbi:MAG TPA: hypothetical protein VKU85_01025, partial [bacterium]|nr:hypothetical protein [bacterium]